MLRLITGIEKRVSQMQSGVERRGEWLELRLLPLHSSTLDELLLGYYQIPLKLLQKLKQQDGIRLKMDSVLLKLFPPEIDEYATEWVDIDILFEDDEQNNKYCFWRTFNKNECKFKLIKRMDKPHFKNRTDYIFFYERQFQNILLNKYYI